MTVNINVIGIGQAKTFMKQMNQVLETTTSVGLKNAAIFLRGKISISIARGTNAPKAFDTGDYSRLIYLFTGKNNASVFSTRPYGKFVEYGTSKMSARPHFRNTLAKSKHKIATIMQQSVNKNI